MKDPDKLRNIIFVVYEKRKNAISISPAVLANEAMTYLDPSGLSDPMISLAANLYFRQVARAVCRGFTKEVEDTQDAFEFHKALQKRYPTARSEKSEDPEYILLEHMSDEDYSYNIRRLLREADAKTAHARALKAHWELSRADDAA